MNNKKLKSYKYGLVAESAICWYLKAKGYGIIERRYRNYVGEVDIIAKRRKILAFIEVKARKSGADEVLTSRQRDRITRAASLFIAKTPKFGNSDIRFDLVIFQSLFNIKHIKDAWRPEK